MITTVGSHLALFSAVRCPSLSLDGVCKPCFTYYLTVLVPPLPLGSRFEFAFRVFLGYHSPLTEPNQPTNCTLLSYTRNQAGETYSNLGDFSGDLQGRREKHTENTQHSGVIHSFIHLLLFAPASWCLPVVVISYIPIALLLRVTRNTCLPESPGLTLVNSG